MRKKGVKLVAISMTLLLSISGIVLGEESNIVAIGETGLTNTVNETGKQNSTNIANVTQMDETPLSTSEGLGIPEETYPPSDEDEHARPVETSESPGFGSVLSIVVLLSTIYMTRRR